MSKLLFANFMRIKKSKTFWSCVIFMFGLGIFFPVKRYTDMVQTGWVNNLDNGFYFCAVLIAIVMAVFCSMFIGTEYSDGTIRNKIIVGQRRSAIYLANVVASSLVSIIMCIASVVPYLCLGIPLLGFFTADIKMILLLGVAVLFLAAAFSSVFTLIAMLCRNKATTAVACLLLAFGLIIIGAVLKERLNAPKMISGYSLSIDDALVNTEEPNPKYLEGMKREIVQTIYDILPGGQAVQCTTLTAVNLPRLPFYSVGIILLSTGIGVSMFRKRDLK